MGVIKTLEKYANKFMNAFFIPKWEPNKCNYTEKLPIPPRHKYGGAKEGNDILKEVCSSDKAEVFFRDNGKTFKVQDGYVETFEINSTGGYTQANYTIVK